jgi:3-phenylpropionate/trans-cinnamate dioxygenase ferredoxin reductase subunit
LKTYKYVIVGAGLAGGSAVTGIRQVDNSGSILLLGREAYLPYHRPPLTKGLWLGKKKTEDIFFKAEDFYSQNHVEVRTSTEVIGIDAKMRQVSVGGGESFGYEKLLIATGGLPRRLNVPGGEIEGISYFRYLDDYHRLRRQVGPGKSALVIGTGFIGSEIAAALNVNNVEVTVLQKEEYLVSRVFPKELGEALQEEFVRRGVRFWKNDSAMRIESTGPKFITYTQNGRKIETDAVVVGIGIEPETALASAVGIAVENGIIVNELLETSAEGIYAAGDNAMFPYTVLGCKMRIEHWDHAINHGRFAGMNMVGGREKYDYMPYFFSDLFEFGYEAVGRVDSRLETIARWQEKNNKGVIYYCEGGIIVGVMMCNVWEKVDAARELIKKRQPISKGELL